MMTVPCSKRMVIIGDGEIAEMMGAYVMRVGQLVVAFATDRGYQRRDRVLGFPVVPYDCLETEYPPSDYVVMVGIGHAQMNRLRRRFYLDLSKKGYTLPSYISPQAYVDPTAKIGNNTFIFEMNVIQYNCVIGGNVIIWSANHIGHSTHIDNHCFLASKIGISGHCKIGSSCFIGTGAQFGDEVTLPRDTFVGCGAVITRSVEKVGTVLTPSKAKEALTSSYDLMQVPHESRD